MSATSAAQAPLFLIAPEKARYLGFEQLAIRIPRKPYPIG
jgi:hypothetical protein